MSITELELLAKVDEGALMVFYEELMKKVKQVLANRECVSQPENISNVSNGCISSLQASTISEEMVGLKDVIQQLINQLVRGTPKRDVISIVGMAGQAGVVASMTKKKQWEQVAHNLASQILGDSKQIIQFSYKDLPHHLKPCFLHFGAFSEDKEIPISKLMKLWVAEGFSETKVKTLGRFKEKAITVA
ncbi:hypothetical protein K7X08_026048 [Anisodus acutangulus]|uniref:Uncharacterized protein n=1 Tax=Anisodus acutangulus TaxID=402998 RepID=A0A9Q1N5F9_9SOLA|nr:hypothetical protein K7X08_026048 [Anisodus acutangulus]